MGREETDSPKTPFWTTVSPHDGFAAPLARPQLGSASTPKNSTMPSSLQVILFSRSSPEPAYAGGACLVSPWVWPFVHCQVQCGSNDVIVADKGCVAPQACLTDSLPLDGSTELQLELPIWVCAQKSLVHERGDSKLTHERASWRSRSKNFPCATFGQFKRGG